MEELNTRYAMCILQNAMNGECDIWLPLQSLEIRKRKGQKIKEAFQYCI